MSGVSADMNAKRELFFRLVFGKATGFVCIAERNPQSKKLAESYFRYPDEMPQILECINRSVVGNNVYFCTQLLGVRKRTKESVKTCTMAWADLDTCTPDKLMVKPTVTIESSPGRYQALWIFSEEVDPEEAQDVSRRVAYFHRDEGADVSGWPLSKLVRVPYTYNYKYQNPQEVKIIAASKTTYSLDAFDDYPQALGYEYLEIPFPQELPDLSPQRLLDNYKRRLGPKATDLFNDVPDETSKEKWSGALWQLEMMLFEAGMSREEVFLVARDARCNKYKRDGRPEHLLWQDVCRAANQYDMNTNMVMPKSVKEIPLVSDEEHKYIRDNPGFVERYIEWARLLGDAAIQYHQAGAFIALSSLLAGNVRLPTSYGVLKPNLWFMILADTTLTRKTTAMDIAMDLVTEIEPDSVLATDGSIEGLLGSLSTRPGRPSVFLRDEFSGLLEAMIRRDYYAGMPELFTKLYDGKLQKRVLRRETITVVDPILIVFAGGIRSRITSLLTYEQVASGFMPRFIFVTAESDVAKLKPLGPPTVTNLGDRDKIKQELAEIHAHYKGQVDKTVPGRDVTVKQTRIWNAELTPDAWARYNKIESDLVQVGVEADLPDVMTPVYDRLSKSMLKAAVLLAAAERGDPERIVVDEQHIVRAAHYAETWKVHARQVMNNIGKDASEKQLDAITKAIVKRPDGISRSSLMQWFHLTARDANNVFDTLEQRGQIVRRRSGRAEMLFPLRKETE